MQVDPNAVTKIYMGKDKVCRCGCAGEYIRKNENNPLFERRLKQFMKMLPSYTAQEFDIGQTYRNISYGNDRALTVYFDED